MNSFENKILDSINFSEDLSFNLKNFSYDKELWDYQQEAVKNGIKALWKYYEDVKNYKSGEEIIVNNERKKILYEEYKLHNLEKGLDIELKSNRVKNLRLKKLLENYYPVKEEQLRTNVKYCF